MAKAKDGLRVIVFIVAGVVALGVFSFMSLSSTGVYMATTVLQPGTKITEEMLNDGTIKKVSEPRSLINEDTITNFEDINNKYIKYPVGPGKVIFGYDFAAENDIRTNKTLQSQNLEALSLNADSIVNSVSNLNTEDKVNIYTVEQIDLKTFTNEGMIEIAKLPADIQTIFKEAGNLEESDQVSVGTYKYSKLIAQNIPVVSISKNSETNKVTTFTLGVDPDIAEDTYLAIESGKVGINILPYTDKSYKEKVSTGTLQNLQFVGTTSADKDKVEVTKAAK